MFTPKESLTSAKPDEGEGCFCPRSTQPPFYRSGGYRGPPRASGCCEPALVHPLLDHRITDRQFQRGPFSPSRACADVPHFAIALFPSFGRPFSVRSTHRGGSPCSFSRESPYVTSRFPPRVTRPFAKEFSLDEVRFLCHDAARAARDDSGCIAVSQVFTASIAPPTGNSPGAGEIR